MIKNPPPNAGDLGSIPESGRVPWRRKWQPTLVFLPGESHGQRSLAGYSSRGRKKSDMLSDQTTAYRLLGSLDTTARLSLAVKALSGQRGSLARGSPVSPRGLFCLPTALGRPWRAQAHRLFAGLGEALRMPSDAATALVKDPRFIPWCPVCLRDFAWSFQEPPGGPLRRYSRRFLTLDIDIDTEGPLPRGPAVPRAPLLALLPSSHRAAPWGVYLLGFYLLSVLL